MGKIIRGKRRQAACLLAAVVTLCTMCTSPLPDAYAQNASVAENDAISLKYVSSVVADSEGSVLRIYGDAAATYNHPILVTANCTVILDNIKNDADLTVTDGKQVRLILRGTNRLGNIRAVGGSATLLRIEGDPGGGTLTANEIACAAGGTTETGAVVAIDGCTVFCQSLGCGKDGADAAYWDSGASLKNPTPGSNASPNITISGANLSVSGSVACGGSGVYSSGTWSAGTSDGGSSGEVTVSGSYVTIGGDLAIGGRGGDGKIGSSYYDCEAGMTKSSSPVTVTDHSNVSVTGNVASQPDLPEFSDGGTQSGLNGVTVTVRDSSLSAADIASGGNGHVQVNYNVYQGSGSSYNIYGTAGGDGGTLIAQNAEITCGTAVCGADAGDYMKYECSSLGTMTGDVESANHPRDGKGGVIRETDSSLTVREEAAQKGSRWNNYPNPSTYSDSVFIGGTLRGSVYGDVITTDVTSILDGDFVASTDIRNSEESTCAKCTLKTSGALAGKSVRLCANALAGTVITDGGGSVNTYLGIGKENIKVTGAGTYAGTFMVKRTASLNVFQLEPYGIINVNYGGAVIKSNSYKYTNENYDYDGSYTVTGNSNSAVLTVEDGTHTITLENASFDELTVKGTSHVTLILSGNSSVNKINVEEDASLTIEGGGSLHVEKLGNENGASGTIEILSGKVEAGQLGGGEGSKDILIKDPASVTVTDTDAPLRDADGNLLYPVKFSFGAAGTYTLRFNDKAETVVLSEGESSITRLLAVGDYALSVEQGRFCFRGNVKVAGAQTIYLDDLTLYLDSSAGDITIGEQQISLGADTVRTQADVRILQSGEKHAVHVEKKTASIMLDGVSPDTQIYLPEDFDGLICDVNHTPIQVVTVRTGYANQALTLYLDGKDYGITTNAQGNFSIIATRGKHALGIEIDGMLYQSKDGVSVSSTENVFSLDDLELVWDISTGDITITGEGFVTDTSAGRFGGDYRIVASDQTAGMVTADKSDVNIFLSDGVDSFLQIKVPEDFTGTILKGQTALYPLVISTGCADGDLQVTLDGQTATVHTDGDGRLYLTAEEGEHDVIVRTEDATYIFHTSVGSEGARISYEDLIRLTFPASDADRPVTVVVGDVSVEIQPDETGGCTIFVEKDSQEIFVTDGDKTYRYPIVDGTLGEPEQVLPQTPDADDNTGGDGETGGGKTDGDDNTGGDGETGTDGKTDGDDNTGGDGETGTGGKTDGDDNTGGDGETGGGKADGDDNTGGDGEAGTGGKTDADDKNGEGNQAGADKPDQTGTGGGSSSGGSGNGTGNETWYGSGNGSGSGSGNGSGSGSGNGSGSGSGNEAGSGSGNGTGNGSGNGSEKPDGTGDSSENHSDKPGGAADGSEHPAAKPVISIKSSLKGVKVVTAGTVNSYKTYSRKKVRLTVQREKETEYYYKIAKKGQRPSTVKWKKLTSDRITVENSRYGQRVYIKAVNAAGSTVKKTTGFVVDTKKPVVTGVKNAAVYRGARAICVSDNCGFVTVRLNGKKMPEKFTVQKKGIYILTVTDRAGNKRVVLFAISRV